MISHSTTIRIGYAETDQMGYVHHSNYARHYEIARWELFRNIGIPYCEIEKSGYMLPVVSMSFKFLKPAFYDDTITIITQIKELRGARLNLIYNSYNSIGELINSGETNLAIVHKGNRKPCLAPDYIKSAIQNTIRIETQNTTN